MAVVRNITRWSGDGRDAATERNRGEDLRLMQRINGGAAELHRLWSAEWVADGEERLGRRARVSALQAEIDRLYEQRRQLIAERALFNEAPRIGRRNWGSTVPPALAA